MGGLVLGGLNESDAALPPLVDDVDVAGLLVAEHVEVVADVVQAHDRVLHLAAAAGEHECRQSWCKRSERRGGCGGGGTVGALARRTVVGGMWKVLVLTSKHYMGALWEHWPVCTYGHGRHVEGLGLDQAQVHQLSGVLEVAHLHPSHTVEDMRAASVSCCP